MHALLIDDNVQNCAILKHLLSTHGIATTEVYDPATLNLVLDGLPHTDLIFIDLEMPHLNGYEVLYIFQVDPRFVGAKLIAHTVHVSEINTAHEYGFHGFIPKPLDVDRFADQIERVLRGDSVWDTQ